MSENVEKTPVHSMKVLKVLHPNMTNEQIQKCIIDKGKDKIIKPKAKASKHVPPPKDMYRRKRVIYESKAPPRKVIEPTSFRDSLGKDKQIVIIKV
jgi:hypothetical protein